MATKRYTSSLTSGDLLQKEISEIINAFETYDDLNIEVIKANGILPKAKSEETSKRTVSEALRRIKAVQKKSIWNLYNTCDDKEKKLILFYAVLATYDLALDFYLDVVHEKWMNLQYHLTKADFENYVEQKARNNEALEKKSKRSVADMGINLMRIMRQAGVLEKDQLKEVGLSEQFVKNFNKLGEAWFIDVIPHK